VNDYVCDTAVLGILGELIIIRFWVFGYDVLGFLLDLHGEGEGRNVHQACRRPGMKPRQQRQMLMSESAEQIPRFTQTASGGNRIARRPRKMSVEHIAK
jgi:hypothetical protein